MQKTCDKAGCYKPIHARGLCNYHYYRAIRTGEITPIKYSGTCTIPGCNSPTHARNLCDYHYRRFIRGRALTSPHKKTISEARKKYPCEYNIWKAMNQRCSNSNDKNYWRYGGRGIKVCEQWRGQGGFIKFIEDMGGRPSPEYSIDRINNDGPYSPENCRWTDKHAQRTNQQRVKKYTLHGEEGSLFELYKKYNPHNLSFSGVERRVKQMGWDIEKALNTPPLKTL